MGDEEVSLRLKRLQIALRERQLDAIIITNSTNRTYMSGFKGSAGYVIITQQKAYLLTDSRYTQQAREQAPNFIVTQYAGKPYNDIKNILYNCQVKRLGFEDKSITYAQYNEMIKEFNDQALVPANDVINELRKIKDLCEITNIRKACSIADEAFSHILNIIRPGMTEIEIALELEFFMKRNGAATLSFDTIVASGTRSSLPHGQPTDKKVEVGDLITLDFGCVYNGYCSDMTRTIGLGKINNDQEKIYNIVLEAQMKALEFIQAGKAGKEVDRIARDVIEGKGYGEKFGHGLGHSVGLEIHESPRLSPLEEELLRPGMVVSVEPGIYIEGFGGVRIEDLVSITENGVQILTSSPKNLLII